MQSKVWRTLEATSLLVASSLVVGSLAACSDQGQPLSEAAITNAATNTTALAQPDLSTQVGKSQGAAEGVADSALTAADDVAYLTQIGLMRGHLWVGNALFAAGHKQMSVTHMKHPKAELYSTLQDPFSARGVPGFAGELTTLADQVTNDSSIILIDDAYKKLIAAISDNEQGANTRSPKIISEVIVGLLRVAGEEYAIGVIDGRINNLHEYQDALGFTQVANQWSKSAAFTNSPATAAAATRIQSILTELDSLWPDLSPAAAEGPLGGTAAQLYGAAARIEIEALSL